MHFAWVLGRQSDDSGSIPNKNKGKSRSAETVTPTVTPTSKKLESTESLKAAGINDEKPGDSSPVPVSEASLVELVGVWAAMTPKQKVKLIDLARSINGGKSTKS
ncbi:MAG: hypothetical protein SGI77_04540 [Pirellulaceae bacterium]|nr:hypothetical protein [Pirellulaceae bacterium]